MKRRRKVSDANTSIRAGRDGSRINTHASCLCGARRRICSLSICLSLFLSGFILRSLFILFALSLSRLVDPKYQRTIKYSDDSFVTDECREERRSAI